jgi:hypothetical protein
MDPKKETCFTCEKHKDCRYSGTLENFQPGPVPCVHYQRESDTELVYHDNHIWKRASTNYAHMNGVSWLGWCTRCGAEGASGGPAEHKCYSREITKTYRVGGSYRKSCSKEFLKANKV